MSYLLDLFPWLYILALYSGVLILIPLLYRQGKEMEATASRIAAIEGGSHG